MNNLPPLTVAEARAILSIAKLLNLTFVSRRALNCTLGAQEREAWKQLVASAQGRLALYEDRGVTPFEAILDPEDSAPAPSRALKGEP